MVKILIIDDAKGERAAKTNLYGALASAPGNEITHARFESVSEAERATEHPEYSFTLTTSDQLHGHDVILTDLDGKQPETGNNPDNRRFLELLAVAVSSGAKPVVRMFSGAFENGTVDLSSFPQLQGIVTTHADKEAVAVISSVRGKDLTDEPAATVDFPSHAVSGKSVLVVHRDPLMRSTLEHFLNEKGLPVITTTGQEAAAVYALHRDTIGAIIVNHSGFQPFSQMQNLPPLIGFSGDGKLEKEMHAIQPGAVFLYNHSDLATLQRLSALAEERVHAPGGKWKEKVAPPANISRTK